MNPSRWRLAIIAMFTAAAAAAAVLAIPLLTSHTSPVTASIHARLARCTTTVQSSYRTGYGGYSRVKVVVSCLNVQAKALCKTSPTSGTTRYGPIGKAAGFTSTAYCHSNELLAGAWFRIGSSGWIRTY